ncbi:MAG TPA: RNA polymerase sigma factor [Planctomycetota bacterium]|jgi:RNA polymerase sigma-70 factor (ECF subfamily)|nr:RNA polymerase sigma factor [Planctomycetota bacterium]
MNDRDAIRDCLDGRWESFRFLVERYEREALGHAVALCGVLDTAKDCVQEAFIDAFQSLSRFDTERSFYPWFYTLLRNRCFKHRSRESRKAPVFDPTAFLEPPSGPGESERELLDEALGKMDAAEREILLLKYLDGLRYREISERLDIPMGTVMSRLFNARRSLRKHLDACKERP